MKRVLLTGAAGRIGTAFRTYYGDQYHLRLTDRQIDQLTAIGDQEVVQANVADLAACQELCRGMEMVIHLAADPSPAADFYDSLLDNNIKAAYNIFRAAKDQGCRRVIFASSIQTIEGYGLDTQAHPDMLPKPTNMYAAAKVFGEAMCHYFAHSEGLSCIAVRIGAFEGNRNYRESTEQVDSRTLSAFVSQRDLSHLFAQCLEVENLPFAILQAVSDNRFKRMDITTTRQLVDYAPQDDAFALFNTGIIHNERWAREWGRGARDDKRTG